MTTSGLTIDNSPSDRNQGLTVRTTIVLPVALDRNLEIYCSKSGSSKSKLVERLLFDYLSNQGFRPDKTPKSVEMNVVY
jgi:hypothetical protein